MESTKPTGHISRRRVSAPATTSIDPKTQQAPVETLFFHPDVKIVAFAAPVKVYSLDPETAREEAGTLPSRSQTERTIAIGSFRIYRAAGSVAFLSCGAALHPILPKSQCWCIDEENHAFYVLQVRRPTFWRIELPVFTPENRAMARELKDVWDQVLQFEKTHCPFQRTFSVELPEQPETPIKRKPWTPKHLPSPAHKPFAQLDGNGIEYQLSISPSQKFPHARVGSPIHAGPTGGNDPPFSTSKAELTTEPRTDSITGPATTEISSSIESFSNSDANGLRGQSVSPLVAVASTVAGIHGCFRNLAGEYPLGNYTPRGAATGASWQDQQPSTQMRRHSFDSFVKPASQFSSERFITTSQPTLPNHVVNRGRPTSRSGRSQSTKSISTLEELSQDPAIQGIGLHDSMCGWPRVSGPRETLQSPLPAPPEPVSPPLRRIASSLGKPQEFSPSDNLHLSSVADNSTGLETREPDTRALLSCQDGSRLCRGDCVRPRHGPGPQLPVDAPTASEKGSKHNSAHRLVPRRIHDLPRNVISKTYDCLLLPLAYIIALILKIVARILSFGWSTSRKPQRRGEQDPMFLQYTEDELTE